MTLDNYPVAETAASRGPGQAHRPGRGLLARLAHRLGLAPIPADVAQRLAEMQVTVAALTQAQSGSDHALDVLNATVDKAEKQLARLGKEQFKANLLAETQRQNAADLLDELREAAKQRERELAQLRESLLRSRAEGRLEVVKRVLPALDGLDEALAAGERLLAVQSAPRPSIEEGKTPPSRSPGAAAQDAPGGPRLTFGQRLNAAVSLLMAPAMPAPHAARPSDGVARQAVAGWLQGLDLVQGRLLDLLASEGLYPIETEDETFDPRQHVAVESVPAPDGSAPGRIVRELRRGYRREDGSVLRYAEVVVARGPREGG